MVDMYDALEMVHGEHNRIYFTGNILKNDGTHVNMPLESIEFTLKTDGGDIYRFKQGMCSKCHCHFYRHFIVIHPLLGLQHDSDKIMCDCRGRAIALDDNGRGTAELLTSNFGLGFPCTVSQGIKIGRLHMELPTGETIFDGTIYNVKILEEKGRGKKKQRLLATIRQGSQCAKCRMPVKIQDATYDHKIPKSAGGPTIISNSEMLCRKCNETKGDKSNHN